MKKFNLADFFFLTVYEEYKGIVHPEMKSFIHPFVLYFSSMNSEFTYYSSFLFFYKVIVIVQFWKDKSELLDLTSREVRIVK